VLEIVRFQVIPERRRALIDGHLPARRAIRGVAPPGALWARLAHLGQRGWIEVVAWERRSTFDQALELSQSESTARDWFDLAEPGWTIELARLETPPLAPPPRRGHLEVSWHASGRPPALAGATWIVLGETDGRTLVDPTGWVETRRSVVSLTVVDGGREAGVQPSLDGEEDREGGQIIDSIDAQEEQLPDR
jgi:hypothetical protein